jgi:hypothetical protein
MNLEKTIAELAAKFAGGVLHAIRGASLEEILSSKAHEPAPRKAVRKAPGRARAARAPSARVRRTAEDIGEMVERVVVALKAAPEGLRAEQLRERLNVAREELPKPIIAALASKRVTKKGQKRATTYFAR